MIIGYDFFGDNIHSTENISANIADNDGVAFDACISPSVAMHNVVVQNGVYDELEVCKDVTTRKEEVTKSHSWGENTLMLAKFQNNLSAGSVNVGNNEVYSIQFLKRKKGETEWQLCQEVMYHKNQETYSFTDKYIESQQTYQYAIRPTAREYDYTGAYIGSIIGENSPQSERTEIDVVFDYAHLFDNETSYDLLYNFKLGDITSNIDANTITTLGSQYPFTIYGASKYKSGSVSCLLVTEESATGVIDVWKEKELRNNIDKFLSNKKPKILKCDDGTYLLISISDNYTLIPDENLLGSYSLSFNYTEIGDANDVDTLKRYGLWSNEQDKDYRDSSTNTSYRYGGNLFIQTTTGGGDIDIEGLSKSEIEQIINLADTLDE